jgi:hypothetical protein
MFRASDTCLGCDQGPNHRHLDGEDGPRETCCIHTHELGDDVTYGGRRYRIIGANEVSDFVLEDVSSGALIFVSLPS